MVNLVDQWGLENRTYEFKTNLKSECFVLGWFSIIIIGTKVTAIAIVPTIQKGNQYIEIQVGGYLVRFSLVLNEFILELLPL